MIYPKSYVVCFSKKNDNSAIWGNYADCHKSVCLIFDTGDEAKLKVGGRHIPLDVRAISYGDVYKRQPDIFYKNAQAKKLSYCSRVSWT